MKVNRFGMSQKMFVDMFIAYGEHLVADLSKQHATTALAFASKNALNAQSNVDELRTAHEKLGLWIDEFPRVISEPDIRCEKEFKRGKKNYELVKILLSPYQPA